MGGTIQPSCSNNLILVRNNGLNFCLPGCCHRVTWREGLCYIISELGAGNTILPLGKITHTLIANYLIDFL